MRKITKQPRFPVIDITRSKYTGCKYDLVKVDPKTLSPTKLRSSSRPLYKIIARRSFHTCFDNIDTHCKGYVAAGMLGGCVETEENLSQEDNCWIYPGGLVTERFRITGDAVVASSGLCYGEGRATGFSYVAGTVNDSYLMDDVLVKEGAVVSNSTCVGRIKLDGKVNIQKSLIVGTEITIKNDGSLTRDGVRLFNVQIATTNDFKIKGDDIRLDSVELFGCGSIDSPFSMSKGAITNARLLGHTRINLPEEGFYANLAKTDPATAIDYGTVTDLLITGNIGMSDVRACDIRTIRLNPDSEISTITFICYKDNSDTRNQIYAAAIKDWLGRNYYHTKKDIERSLENTNFLGTTRQELQQVAEYYHSLKHEWNIL
jgi:hypothetical protein